LTLPIIESFNNKIIRHFDSALIEIPSPKKALRAKAVLCPSLRGSLDDQVNGEQVMW
jgi:topoisomerase-4 subunit B